MIAKRRHKIRKTTELAILVGKNSIFGADRPVDGKRWVVPGKTPVALGRIIVIDLIGDHRVRFERAETMRKAARDEKLLAPISSQRIGCPSTIGRGANAEIHCNVIDAAAQHANKLRLRFGRRLEVKASNGSRPDRKRFVILNETRSQTELLARTLTVCLGKMTSRVIKIPRLQ